MNINISENFAIYWGRNMSGYKVLIDTNIYDGANYSFENPRFSTLRRYADNGYLSLLTNSIIQGEVEKHIQERLKEATQAINTTLNDFSRDFASFHYDEPYKSRLEPFDRDDMANVCIGRFHAFMSACHTEIITANGIDVEAMIDDYAHKAFPFQEAKPEEFKDAMTIRSFVKYYLEQEQSDGKQGDKPILCVVSADKGFRKGLKRLLPEIHNICIYHDLDGLIKLITAFDARIQALTSYLASEYVTDDINEKIQRFLEDVSYYVDDPTDEFDLIDVGEILYKLLWVDIISEHLAKANFEVEAEIKVWYSYIDEDRSFFDKEDWCYLWKAEVEKEERHKISFEITLDIDLSDFGSHSDAAKNEYGEYIFDFDYCIEVVGIADAPKSIDLDDDTCLESEVTDNDPFHEDDEGRSYATNACPDGGSPMNIANDGGNGFCVNCAPKH